MQDNIKKCSSHKHTKNEFLTDTINNKNLINEIDKKSQIKNRK